METIIAHFSKCLHCSEITELIFRNFNMKGCIKKSEVCRIAMNYCEILMGCVNLKLDVLDLRTVWSVGYGEI